MADFEQAGATERLRRVAILREMQAKLKRSPAEALDVAVGAGPQEVRSAFMALTKQYHPAKFARLDEATVKLANEVFLQLREAYELLATAGNKRARTVPGVGPGEPELAKKPEAGAAASAGQGVRVPDRASTATGLGGPVRFPDRAPASASSAPAAANPPPAGTAGTAGRRPLLGGQRPTTGAPATAAPTRPSSPSMNASIGGARPGQTAPPTRPSAPSISTSTAGSASVPAALSSARPSTVAAAGSGKVAAPALPASGASAASGAPASGAPAGSAAPPAAAGGPKIRFGASAPTAPPPSSASAAAPGLTPSAELVRIRGLIQRQKWTEARDALQLLLLRAPTDRGSMAQLAYVRGREALELGNVSEARRELLRALAIEPAMEAARATLRELNDATPSSNPSAPRR